MVGGFATTEVRASAVEASAVEASAVEASAVEHVPKVSIGLAVFNGERYLEAAIQSILAQTFRDFELIISDNASTDRTAEICRKYAEQDSRVRYSRNETNIGGGPNHNRTFELARGEYFRWAAHDDICGPELIEKCVAVLDRDPAIALAYSQIVFIDDDGCQKSVSSRRHASSPHAHERFAGIASQRDGCEESYGLCRSAIIRKTKLLGNYTNSDRTLLSELALYGTFELIEEPLFYKRNHAKNVYLDWRARMAWFNPAFEGKIKLPYFIQFRDYLAVIERAEVPREVKLRCYAYMLRWLLLFSRFMGKDVYVALYMLAHSREWRKKQHARANNWT